MEVTRGNSNVHTRTSHTMMMMIYPVKKGRLGLTTYSLCVIYYVMYLPSSFMKIQKAVKNAENGVVLGS